MCDTIILIKEKQMFSEERLWLIRHCADIFVQTRVDIKHDNRECVAVCTCDIGIVTNMVYEVLLAYPELYNQRHRIGCMIFDYDLYYED
jgi:hypothetical protein